MHLVVLLSEERNNYSRPFVQQAAGGGTGSTVMDHCCDTFEKPLMWTVSDVQDLGIEFVYPLVVLIIAKLAPASRDDGPYPGLSYGSRQYLG